MTPRQTALRLMAQTGTTVGHPDFVVAYLEAERAQDRQAFHTDAQKAQEDLQEVAYRLKAGVAAYGDAFAQIGRAVTAAGERIARNYRPATRDQFTLT